MLNVKLECELRNQKCEISRIVDIQSENWYNV